MTGHELLDGESDYGSDFSPEDEQLLIQLVSGTTQAYFSTAVDDALAVSSSDITFPDDTSGQTDNLHHNERLNHARKDDCYRSQTSQSVVRDSSSPGPDSVVGVPFNTDVTYPDLSRALTELARSQKRAKTRIEQSDGREDDRSPLQRFRSFPNRPLAVSDLTAGAWCELQYWYTLTKLPGGRRTRTAAMKGGTKIHKKLEDEVHTTVKIDVMTKEDEFALKLWNFIHGLRTLRETGLTRELEVWGVVDGNFVNGVIDSVSHHNPNPEFEKELVQQSKGGNNQKPSTDLFMSRMRPAETAAFPSVYLADVKTRGSLTPVKKPSLRPAKIQLMLYHRFLSQIAAGRLDFLGLFHRYGLDADKTLSDHFLAQMEDLHDEVFHDSCMSDSDASGAGESIDSERTAAEELASSAKLKYQTLEELAFLVREEVKKAFPRGHESMGQMLRVQYVHRDDGREIDVHDFPVSGEVLNGYLKGYMSWWRGERKAVGVQIEEAFKCRSCEFADECSWRNAKVDKQLLKAQKSILARRAKSVF
ncbi:hypothetical protein E4U21_006509 [Claviceps maximensis]|nr:hypothetical protein E4U21_006509 [Claviceps maximensis]